MRRQRVDPRVVDARQQPEESEGDGDERQPLPQPHPRQRECRRGHHRKIDVERPVVRRVRRDQQRRHVGADEAERRQRRAVQQRRAERRQRHRAEQHEGEGRIEEAVKPVGRIDRGIGDGGAGGGQDARDVGGRDRGKARKLLLPARPFAADDESGREQRAEEQPQAGADQAGLDGVFDEEDAAERERHAADPDRPAGAELFLEADDAFGLAGVGRLRGRRDGRFRAAAAARSARPSGGGSAAANAGGAGTGWGVGGGGAAGAMGAAPGAPAERSSSAAKRASIPRRRSLMLIVLTSATMAMIGNASSAKPMRTKKSMCAPARPNLCVLNGRR